MTIVEFHNVTGKNKFVDPNKLSQNFFWYTLRQIVWDKVHYGISLFFFIPFIGLRPVKNWALLKPIFEAKKSI